MKSKKIKQIAYKKYNNFRSTLIYNIEPFYIKYD